MGKNLLRSFHEKPVGDPLRLVQRDGHSLGLGLAPQLLRRAPERHPGVERIEHDVAAMRVVKLLHKLTGRVVDDGALAALCDLKEHLADDAGFARAGVADDEKMLVLGVARNAQWQLGIVWL